MVIYRIPKTGIIHSSKIERAELFFLYLSLDRGLAFAPLFLSWLWEYLGGNSSCGAGKGKRNGEPNIEESGRLISYYW